MLISELKQWSLTVSLCKNLLFRTSNHELQHRLEGKTRIKLFPFKIDNLEIQNIRNINLYLVFETYHTCPWKLYECLQINTVF